MDVPVYQIWLCQFKLCQFTLFYVLPELTRRNCLRDAYLVQVCPTLGILRRRFCELYGAELPKKNLEARLTKLPGVSVRPRVFAGKICLALRFSVAGH